MSVSTEVTFLDKPFTNPIVLASGILGVTGACMAKVIRDGAGGVIMKSVTVEPIEGNPSPIMLGEEGYFLNAVGLPGPGASASIDEVKKFKELNKEGMMIGSIFGRTIEEFGQATETLCQAPIDLLEVNVSCPHASHLYKKPFAHDTESIEKITKTVKEHTTVPFSIKLSPNTYQIAEYAKAAEAAGADAISAVNTITGMKVNIQARRPVLSNKVGGVSGPAIKPMALKAVWDIYQAVKIPIIGTGGITNGEDAIEMLMVGARLLGVGSAFYYRGPKTPSLIVKEMQEIMEQQGFSTIEEIIGLAHNE